MSLMLLLRIAAWMSRHQPKKALAKASHLLAGLATKPGRPPKGSKGPAAASEASLALRTLRFESSPGGLCKTSLKKCKGIG